MELQGLLAHWQGLFVRWPGDGPVDIGEGAARRLLPCPDLRRDVIFSHRAILAQAPRATSSSRRETARSDEVERRAVLSDRQANVFQFHVVVDPVTATLAAKAGLLDPAEGRHLVGDEAGVDADHAVFQRFLHPGDAADVTRVEVGRKAEDGVVRHLDDFGFGLELEQRGERSEGLFLRHFHVRGDAGYHCRLEERPAKLVPLATGHDLAAPGEDVGDMLFDLVHRGFIDQRAGGDPGLQPVADGQFLHGGSQLFGKGVIDPGLHVDPVRADAGLAVVAELRDHCAFDGRIQIGVVKDDEGGVAAKLHRALQHLVGGLTQQDAAHLGRPGEGQLADQRVLAEFLADVGRPLGGDDRKEASRNAGAFGQNRQSQGGQRSLCRRTRDEAAASSKSGGYLAGDHRVREVPRRDRGGNPDRLLQHGDALVALVARNGVAIDALGFFAVPFDVGRAIGDLAFGFGNWLAHFGGQDRGQIVLVRHAQVEPLAHDLRAFLAGAGRPLAVCCVRGLDGAGGLGPAKVRQVADHIAARRVGDGESRAVIGIDPVAGDIGLRHQKRGVFQKRREVGHGIEHGGLH